MPRITEIFVFVAGPEDDEGVVAFSNGLTWFPMVAADRARIESLRREAQEIANQSGKPVRLLRFSVREDLETIVAAHRPGVCRRCGCTDDDCSACVARTGSPCHWVEPDLCSACVGGGA